MKPYSNPARIRVALAYTDRHGRRAAMDALGISKSTLHAWIRARDESGDPNWPPIEWDQEWAAAQERRRKKAASVASWRKRAYVAGGSTLIDATGTGRRVQALMRLGWTGQHIAQASGCPSAKSVRDLTRYGRIKADAAEQVAAAYEQLSMRPGPSSRTRRHAEKQGWPPPLAWDEGTIDNPDATPRGTRLNEPKRRNPNDIDPVNVERLLLLERVTDTTRAEKEAAMARWVASGGTVNALCDAHGWQQGRYVARKRGAA